MKSFTEYNNELSERVVNIAQRKKQGRRMAVLAKSSAFQAKKKRTMMKVRDSTKLLVVARKQTLKTFRNRLYPDYDQMPMAQKVKSDQLVMKKYGAKIDKVSKKVAMKLKSKEAERVANLKASEVEK